MKRSLTILTLGLLLLAVLVWALAPSPIEVEIAEATQGRFERAIQEDGKTRLRDRYVVSMPLSGRVARITLQQGDVVSQGSIVASIWPSAPALLDSRARAEQTQRITAAQALLERGKVNVQKAKIALSQAQSELKRSEALVRQGFISATQHEATRLVLNLRERDLEAAQQDAKIADTELAQVRIALQEVSAAAAASSRRAFTVVAPSSGKVLKVLQSSEGTLAAGTPLIEIGDPSRLEVVVDLLTQDAAQIKPGTPVKLSNWGGTADLEGLVRLVEPAAFTKISALGVEEQRVNTIIDITTPAPQWAGLGDGYKVDVRVLVQVENQVIKVPVSAVFPVGAKSAVFVVEQGKARLREIELMARNGFEAWVQTGIAAGTQVIIYPDKQLNDGDAVTSRSAQSR